MKKFFSHVLISTLFSSVIIAQSGSLDSTFGDQGIVITDIGTNSTDLLVKIAIQPDQKILAVGNSNAGGTFDFTIVRYLPDGTRDAYFGDNGTRRVDFNNSYDGCHAVAVQPDGRIILAGETNKNSKSDFSLVRLAADGAIDSTFGVNGKVIADLGFDYEYANAVTVLQNGKIIAAGKTADGSVTTANFTMVRFNADGQIDSTFGINGIAISSVRDEDEAQGIIILPNGKIVLGGFASVDASGDYAMVGYLEDGMEDKSFGIGGRVVTDLKGTGNSDYETAVLLDKDGKIVLGGTANYNSFSGDTGPGMVRYDSQGHLDIGFGVGGIDILYLGGVTEIQSIAQQPDGKYLLAGKSDAVGFKNKWLLMRLKNDGTRDSIFGNNGIVVTDMAGDPYEVANSITLQKDSKIVVGGLPGDFNKLDFILARYIADFVITAKVVGNFCPVEENAEIDMNVSGGAEPYLYSLDGINFTGNDIFSGLAAGVYNVTIKDANGVTATYGPVQIDTVIGPPVQVDVVGSTITVTIDGGVPPFNYSIDGGNTFQSSNVFTNVPDGAYNLFVGDGNGCVIYNNPVLVLATGVKDIAELTFSISPNPTRDFISIQLERKSNSLKAMIVDMKGQIISSEVLQLDGQGKFTINGEQLLNGQYQLWLQDGDSWGRASFVVAR